MSITTTQPPHPVVGAVAVAGAALKDVRDTQPVFMTAADKQAALGALRALKAQAAELELRVLAAATDEEAQEAGFRDVTGWLAKTTRSDRSDARAARKLAEALDRRWTGVATAMADGDVSPTQAKAVTDALDALPDHLGSDVLASAEETLVGYCDRFTPAELRRLGRHILDVAAPEIADQEDAKRLEAEEQAARDKARLSIRHRDDGLTRISGLIPTADAKRLETYLEAYTSPRHDHSLGEGDRLPYARKLAHAFGALLEHLDPTKLPAHGGDATTVIVTVTLDALQTQLATAGILGPDLETGPNLSATQARRLACTAKILPAVLSSEGEVLDLGRSRRLFSPAQRKAIRLRDKRCRAHGCSVKAQWTEVHHLKPWATGGATDLANGISLCNWHHHRIEDPRFTHETQPDGDILIRRRT